MQQNQPHCGRWAVAYVRFGNLGEQAVETKDWVTALLGLVAVIVSMYGLSATRKSNSISEAANAKSEEANKLAREANRISQSANAYARESNMIAQKSFDVENTPSIKLGTEFLTINVDAEDEKTAPRQKMLVLVVIVTNEGKLAVTLTGASIAFNDTVTWLSYKDDTIGSQLHSMPPIPTFPVELGGWKQLRVPKAVPDVTAMLRFLRTVEGAGLDVTERDAFVVKVTDTIGREFHSAPMGADILIRWQSSQAF